MRRVKYIILIQFKIFDQWIIINANSVMNWEMNQFYREEGDNTFPPIDVGKYSYSNWREGGGGMILNRR